MENESGQRQNLPFAEARIELLSDEEFRQEASDLLDRHDKLGLFSSKGVPAGGKVSVEKSSKNIVRSRCHKH